MSDSVVFVFLKVSDDSVGPTNPQALLHLWHIARRSDRGNFDRLKFPAVFGCSDLLQDLTQGQ